MSLLTRGLGHITLLTRGLGSIGEYIRIAVLSASNYVKQFIRTIFSKNYAVQRLAAADYVGQKIVSRNYTEQVINSDDYITQHLEVEDGS